VPDLNFEILGAQPLAYAASPKLVFELSVENPTGERVQSILLRCQIQIEALQRSYTTTEQESLRDLFDDPARWSKTLKTTLWTHASVVVPPFDGRATADVPVDCSFDFNIAATKYFAGLETGEVPLVFQFSGTVFYKNEDDALQVTQIPWSKEAKFRLPVTVWREMMEMYYPNSAWLNLQQEVFNRLYQYKVRHGIPTFEQTLEKLLAADELKAADDSKAAAGGNGHR
jgi:hypothetical protein